jgi:hypothetical protein
MILKLIETNATPKMGDLVTNPKNGLIRVASETTLLLHEANNHLKVLKPYGYKDWTYESDYGTVNQVLTPNETSIFYINKAEHIKKVSILPEQFNYQDIVDLGLKDGDEFKADIMCHNCDGTGRSFDASDMSSRRCRHCHGTGRARKVSISKPTPEKDIDMLLNEFGNELMNRLAWREIQNSSNGIAQFVTEFLNKKKQDETTENPVL